MADNNNPIKYSDLISPDTSITDLITQLEKLRATYADTAKEIKQQALQVSVSLQNVSGATESGRKSTQKAVDETDRLAKAQRDLAQAESHVSIEIARLKEAQREQNALNKANAKIANSAEGSYNALSAQYTKNKIYLNALSAEERKNNKEMIALEKETRKIYERMKELQEATGKYQLNVGNYTNSIKDALGINNEFGNSLLKLGKDVAEGKTALESMRASASAFLTTLKGFLTNPVFLALAGISGAVMAFKWWYNYNKGVQEASRLTREFLNITGKELDDVRTKIQSVADVYNKDYLEVLKVVDTLTTRYGISAQEALNIINKGFQAGADLSGNMLQQIQQFAPTFKDAGISAEQLVAMIAQTRSGIFSEQGMALIEMASKRLREMASGTKSALEAIGMSGDEIMRQLSEGSKSTFDIIQEISAKIKQLPKDSQEVGNILKDVFGRQGAGAGIQMIESLETMTTDINEVIQVTGEYGAKIEEVRKSNEKLHKVTDELFASNNEGWSMIEHDLTILKNNFLIAIYKSLIGIRDTIASVYGWAKKVPALFEAMKRTLIQTIPSLGTAVNLVNIATGAVKGKLKQAQTSKTPTKVTATSTKTTATETTTEESALVQSLRNKIAELEKQNATKSKGTSRTKVEKTTTEHLEKVKDAREEELRLLQVERETIQLRLQAVAKGSKEQSNLRKELININEQIALMQNALKPEDEKQAVIDIINVYESERAKLKQDAIRLLFEQVEMETDVQMSEIDAMRTTEREKTRLRLEAEKERINKILALQSQFGNILKAEEIKILQNQIKAINNELERNMKGGDLYDMLGFKLDNEKKQAINQSASFVMEQLSSITNSIVESANRAVSASQKEVDAKQSALDKELELRANGYANNVAYAQKELENAKKNQDKALKQQEKAQKLQLALQSIEQISNLVTASTLIWKQLGFPWALGAIGAMWGSFAIAKIKASQLVKSGTEKYGDGTIELLQGGSHQSGNDIDLGTKADGTRRRAEGGEFFAVINKRSSRQYRKIIPDVIKSLNNGTFADKYATAYSGGKDGINLTLSAGGTDIRELNENVRTIKEQGQRRITYANGVEIQEYKNLKRIVR